MSLVYASSQPHGFLSLGSCHSCHKCKLALCQNLQQGLEHAWCDLQEKLNTKTVNEELTANPELLKQVDEDIAKGSYY